MASQTQSTINHDGNNNPATGVYVPSASPGFPAGTGVTNLQGGPAVQDANNNYYAPAMVQLTPASAAVGLATSNTGLPVNTPAIVQKAHNVSSGSVASLAEAFANSNTAGNSIIVVCAVGNGTAPTVADSAGNTYTQAALAANSTTFEAAVFYAVNILAATNTVTVTNAGSTASMAMEIYEVSGLIAQVQAQPDQSATNTGSSGTASTPNIAPASPNELAFAGVAVGTAAQTITAGSGWTNDSGQQNPTTPAGLYSFISMSQFLATLASVSPKATFTTEPWAIAAATFRPVVLGIEGTVSIGGYNYTNITTQTTTLIKAGAGTLHAVIINTPLASGVVEFDDALTHTTPKIGTITLPGTLLQDGPKVGMYDVTFNTGLSITTSGATQDITVVWK